MKIRKDLLKNIFENNNLKIVFPDNAKYPLMDNEVYINQNTDISIQFLDNLNSSTSLSYLRPTSINAHKDKCRLTYHKTTSKEAWCHWLNHMLNCIPPIHLPPPSNASEVEVKILDKKKNEIAFEGPIKDLFEYILSCSYIDESAFENISIKEDVLVFRFINAYAFLHSSLPENIDIDYSNNVTVVETLRDAYKKHVSSLKQNWEEQGKYQKEYDEGFCIDDKKYYILDTVMVKLFEFEESIEKTLLDPVCISWLRNKIEQNSIYAKRALLNLACCDANPAKKQMFAKTLREMIGDEEIQNIWKEIDFTPLFNRKLWKSLDATNKGFGISREDLSQSISSQLVNVIKDQAQDPSGWIMFVDGMKDEHIDHLKSQIAARFWWENHMETTRGWHNNNKNKSWKLLQDKNLVPKNLSFNDLNKLIEQKVDNNYILSKNPRMYNLETEKQLDYCYSKVEEIKNIVLALGEKIMISEQIDQSLSSKKQSSNSVKKRKM